MTEQINKILEEIFLIDSDLKEHEEDLRKIMNDLVKQKPDTKFDEAFKEELKFKLLERAEELVELKQKKQTWFQEFFVPKNLSFAFVGATLSLVIVIPVVVSFMGGVEKFSIESMTTNKASDKSLSFRSEIKNVSSNAFGNLSNNQDTEFLRDEMDMTLQADRDGDGLVSESAKEELAFSQDDVSNFLDNEATESVAPSVMINSKMIMPYNMVKYEYVYSGEDFKLNNDTLLVYKKILNKSSGKDMSSVLKKFDFGMTNLDKFDDVKVKQISMAEEKEFGFQINVNFEDESISIYQNWNKWPRPDKNCRDEACFQSHRLKPSDVPSNNEIVSVADEFIKSLGLDMGFYGKAVVQSRWGDRAMEEGDVWVPEEMNVIYPLKFNSQTVYDTSGNVNGLNVNVNIRYMRVSGVYQIAAQRYESSSYSAITDSETILNQIKKGGFMNNQWYRDEKQTETVQVELGEPTLDLMRYHKYHEEKKETEELFVPALIFPIKNISDKQSYNNRKAVVVPLVREIIENDERDKMMGRPEPMLIIER